MVMNNSEGDKADFIGVNEVVKANNVIAELASDCRHDPLLWAKHAWFWGSGALTDKSLRDWQADILAMVRDHIQNPETRFKPLRIAVASGHGIGKSALMGMFSNWAMSCHKNARVLVTANTFKQLTDKTGPEVSRWFRSSLTGDSFEYTTQSISFKAVEGGVKGNWRVSFVSWSAHNTEAFAGLHNVGSIILILFDEASAIDSKVWEVASGALTDADTIIVWLCFGNPTQNKGSFYDCFHPPARAGGSHKSLWNTRHIDSRTVEGVNLETLNDMVDIYGVDSDFVKVRVLGQFPNAAVSQFIGRDLVEQARARHLRPQQYRGEPVVFGVDPAWSGADHFEVYLRQGLYSKHLLTCKSNENDVDITRRILELVDQYNADLVFIDQAYGTGIQSAFDHLTTNTRKYQRRLIHFGSKSSRTDCFNKRAEMWLNLRDWLENGGVLDINDTVIPDQLTAPELVYKAHGLYQLEDKSTMKRRGVPSPDRADALALTFAEPTLKRGHKSPGHKVFTSRRLLEDTYRV